MTNTSHYPDLERCKKLTELGFTEFKNGISNLFLNNGNTVLSFDKSNSVYFGFRIYDNIKCDNYQEISIYPKSLEELRNLISMMNP